MNPDTKLTKVYLKNFLYFAIIFTGAMLLFSMPTELDEPPREFNFLRGYSIASLLATIGLGHMIAMKFVDSAEKDIEKKKK